MFPFQRKVPILQPFDSLFQPTIDHTMQMNPQFDHPHFQQQPQTIAPPPQQEHPQMIQQRQQMQMDEEFDKRQRKTHRFQNKYVPPEILEHQKFEMNQIVDKEDLNGNESANTRNWIFIRKLNICLLYFLLKECNGYKAIVQKKNITNSTFLYVDKLFRDNDIVFDIDLLTLHQFGANKMVLVERAATPTNN